LQALFVGVGVAVRIRFQHVIHGSCCHHAQEDPDRSIADVRPTGGRALPTPPDKEITATSAGCAAFPVEPRRRLTDARLVTSRTNDDVARLTTYRGSSLLIAGPVTGLHRRDGCVFIKEFILPIQAYLNTDPRWLAIGLLRVASMYLCHQLWPRTLRADSGGDKFVPSNVNCITRNCLPILPCVVEPPF